MPIGLGHCLQQNQCGWLTWNTSRAIVGGVWVGSLHEPSQDSPVKVNAHEPSSRVPFGSPVSLVPLHLSQRDHQRKRQEFSRSYCFFWCQSSDLSSLHVFLLGFAYTLQLFWVWIRGGNLLFHYLRRNVLGWFWKCGPRTTSSSSITKELIRNANESETPRPGREKKKKNCFHKPPGHVDAFSSLRTSGSGHPLWIRKQESLDPSSLPPWLGDLMQITWSLRLFPSVEGSGGNKDPRALSSSAVCSVCCRRRRQHAGGSLGTVPLGWEQSSRSLLPATQPAGPQPRTKWHVLPLGLAREVAQCQLLLIANLHWTSRQSSSCECRGYLVLPQPLLATTQGAAFPCPPLWGHSLQDSKRPHGQRRTPSTPKSQPLLAANWKGEALLLLCSFSLPCSCLTMKKRIQWILSQGHRASERKQELQLVNMRSCQVFQFS